MPLEQSIHFLLQNAGPVIQYRLRKEILHDLPVSEEAHLLERIEQLPHFQLVKSYVKPSGYIGSGMHSWDNWRGKVLHETPLQDGETAARLLSYYRIPKTHPIVSHFVAALRDETLLREAFSYIPPEISRYENRFVGLHNGNCLMALIYTMQALLGYGDDDEDIRAFQQTALKGFRRVLEVSSLEEVAKVDVSSKRRYNYPCIGADEYFPNSYTLALLAHTRSWRSDKNIRMLADALNHISAIMNPENNLHVCIKGKYVVPYFALIRPFRAFHADLIDSILYRRVLTEIAMLGVGEKVDVIRESVVHIKEALDDQGILRMNFSIPHNKRYSPKQIVYPGPYNDVRLEADYKSKNALLCDLTFWAVEFLHLVQST